METFTIPEDINQKLDSLVKDAGVDKQRLILGAIKETIEDLEDLRIAKERQGERTRPFSKVVEELGLDD